MFPKLFQYAAILKLSKCFEEDGFLPDLDTLLNNDLENYPNLNNNQFENQLSIIYPTEISKKVKSIKYLIPTSLLYDPSLITVHDKKCESNNFLPLKNDKKLIDDSNYEKNSQFKKQKLDNNSEDSKNSNNLVSITDETSIDDLWKRILKFLKSQRPEDIEFQTLRNSRDKQVKTSDIFYDFVKNKLNFMIFIFNTKIMSLSNEIGLKQFNFFIYNMVDEFDLSFRGCKELDDQLKSRILEFIERAYYLHAKLSLTRNLYSGDSLNILAYYLIYLLKINILAPKMELNKIYELCSLLTANFSRIYYLYENPEKLTSKNTNLTVKKIELSEKITADTNIISACTHEGYIYAMIYPLQKSSFPSMLKFKKEKNSTEIILIEDYKNSLGNRNCKFSEQTKKIELDSMGNLYILENSIISKIIVLDKNFELINSLDENKLKNDLRLKKLSIRDIFVHYNSIFILDSENFSIYKYTLSLEFQEIFHKLPKTVVLERNAMFALSDDYLCVVSECSLYVVDLKDKKFSKFVKFTNYFSTDVERLLHLKGNVFAAQLENSNFVHNFIISKDISDGLQVELYDSSDITINEKPLLNDFTIIKSDEDELNLINLKNCKLYIESLDNSN